MKAFLLAAGQGTRLRPLSDTVPKCLVPIRDEPLLGIWLKHLRRQGVGEVCINLHAGAPQVREYLQSGSWGLSIRLAEEPVLLGSAGTVAANRAWVEHEEYFGIIYADVLTDVSIGPLLQLQRDFAPAATLGLFRTPDPRSCGIAEVDPDGVIVAFEEKPAHPRGDLAFSGVMIAGRELLQVLPGQAPADLGTQVLPRLVGRLRGLALPGFLLDIGTMENYNLAQTSWPHHAESGEPNFNPIGGSNGRGAGQPAASGPLTRRA